jgi:RNA polymerase sigma-70 factor (ECF subfamily)
MARSLRQAARAPASLRTLADEELLQLAGENDAAAFEVVFERHVDAAYALARRICGARALAEDAVQEAFLSIWRSAARYDPGRGSVRTWTLGIVHHRAIDLLRRAGVHERRRASDEGLEERIEAPDRTDHSALRSSNARDIRVALRELPAEQRRVIELAYFGGFTHAEIAEITDAPSGTVKGRMRLGLQKLRGDLAGWEAIA